MNVFKLILHNIKAYRFISILIVLNIVVSAFVVCFSYGIYQNYNTVIEEGSSSNRQLWIVPTSSPLEKVKTSGKGKNISNHQNAYRYSLRA